MNWMFWKKEGRTKRLPGPKNIPQSVGMHLVKSAKMSPDLVWTLKAVVLPRASDTYLFDIRLYDSNKAHHEGVEVVDYHSLDDHRGLIIFDGWYNDANGLVGQSDTGRD
ncbi:MAG: hypothetical protein M0009_00710 [Deltaproteobacteria bacterium]|nr:hypothetical protein [Deltaproteobacteria bacterium]